MSAERLRPSDLGLAFLALVVATVAVWPMGWLRDDWLHLWRAIDPATAPALATGVFPRPVAEGLWSLAARIAGDQPWALHGLTLLIWWIYLVGLLRWHRAWGGRTSSAALVVALFAVGHGALVEPRLWAAASNAVLSAALGVWGAWLLGGSRAEHQSPGWPRSIVGTLLLLAGILARADAVLWIALVLAERRGFGRTATRVVAWLVAAAVGAVALNWMVAAGGEWIFRPADTGRLLRMLLVPWGSPLPVSAQAAVAGVAVLFAIGVLFAKRVRGPRRTAILATTAAVALAGGFVSWAPAGRYLLVPAGALALGFGRGWETARGRQGGWATAALIGLILLLHLGGSIAGRSTRDLLERSQREMGFYEAVRAEADSIPTPLIVADPPELGWHGDAADLENIASCAARKLVPVRVLRGAVPASELRPVLRWDGEAWVWLR